MNRRVSPWKQVLHVVIGALLPYIMEENQKSKTESATLDATYPIIWPPRSVSNQNVNGTCTKPFISITIPGLKKPNRIDKITTILRRKGTHDTDEVNRLHSTLFEQQKSINEVK